MALDLLVAVSGPKKVSIFRGGPFNGPWNRCIDLYSYDQPWEGRDKYLKNLIGYSLSLLLAIEICLSFFLIIETQKLQYIRSSTSKEKYKISTEC
jgi:hypothetical protein